MVEKNSKKLDEIQDTLNALNNTMEALMLYKVHDTLNARTKNVAALMRLANKRGNEKTMHTYFICISIAMEAGLALKV